MKTRLTIEEYDIAIDNMSLNNVTILKTVCNRPSVSELEVLFKTVVPGGNVISTRVYVAAISYSFAESINIEARHTLGIC